ncbi:MAG: Biotin transporter BioY [Chlamydiae bacterium]|nr:Biotin transporter BioY [Chlamydiota bacterium]
MEITQTLSQNRFRDLFIVLGVSMILALAAWVSIRLPFTPIPICFTAQLVLFFAVFLGKRGAYATALYVAQGAMGLPVFSNGGCGLTYMMGPTGGYIIGFLIATYAVGTLVEKLEEKTPAKIFALLLFGNALIYIFGLPQLALLVGGENALKFGFYPFIAGDLLKLIIIHRSLKALKFFG